MSVIMTFRVKGDPKKLEEVAGSDPENMRSIADNAKKHGLIAHRFYGSDEGEIMVVDEWPDPESFQTFFGQEEGRIRPLMDEVGVQSEPQITFWRRLETHDEVGWDA